VSDTERPEPGAEGTRPEVTSSRPDPIATFPHRAPERGGPSATDPRAWREFRPDDPPPLFPQEPGHMPFLQHLEELRGVLQRSVLAVAVGAVAGWWLAPIVLQDAISRTVKAATVMSPFEAFNERLKLMAILGGLIALPIVLWQVWSFVVPGLLRRERSWVLPLVMGSVVLFVAGAAGAYFYVVPLVVHVLEGFLVPGMLTQIRLSFLLDFTYNLALACGILAQLPMVTMLLTAVGITTPGFLLRQWRLALVAIFILTALITPGDVVSAQLVMGVPMALLYFLSVALSVLVARKRAKAEEEWLGPPTEDTERAKS
jgi:sec-independent protein translocase protein TatC